MIRLALHLHPLCLCTQPSPPRKTPHTSPQALSSVLARQPVPGAWSTLRTAHLALPDMHMLTIQGLAEVAVSDAAAP